jgi:hypothetical protein
LVHASSQAGAGRSQLRISAAQKSFSRSPSQPGRSLQRTATQRARGRSIVAAPRSSRPAVGPALRGVVAVAAGVDGAVVKGVLEQATRAATSAPATVVPRIGAAASRVAHGKARVMWVILLEALGAGALLVFIVWWTMFSGRRRGERRDDDPG